LECGQDYNAGPLRKVVRERSTILKRVLYIPGGCPPFPQGTAEQAMQIANPSAVWHFVRAALCVTGCVLVFGLSLRAGVHEGEISGRVLDMQGVAVAGARLRLVDSAGTLIRETESDQQGHFDFSGVAPGPYQLPAEISLFAPARVVVTVVAGDHADVILQFR
jgi:hypothetical protein